MKRRTGSDLMLGTLLSEGVRHIFGNPGTTELPLMDALVTEKGLAYVLCLQESVAVGAAEGYAFASGGAGVINLHVAPGLGNALGMLYNSKRAGTPLVVTAGNQGQEGHLCETVLWDDLPRMAAPLTKWAYEVRRVEDLEQALRRAVKVALSPPTGPVFLSLPGDVMLAPPPPMQGSPTRIATAFPAAEAGVRRAAEALAQARRPAIVAGSGVTRSGAVQELVRLAERLGAQVFGESASNTIAFPLGHPLYSGELVRVAKHLRAQLEGFDLLFFIGTEAFILSFPPDVPIIPAGTRTMHLDLNAWEIGKNYPADPALLGDPGATLALLLPALEEALGEAGRARAQERRREAELTATALRKKLTPPALTPESESAKGMPPAVFQAALGEALPRGCALVDESITTGGPGLRQAVAGKAGGYFGMKGGGIGLGLPTALGVKVALPERPVVCVSGDGSAMYTIQTLWSAARYGVGCVWIIANNRSYRILKERVLNLQGNSQELRRFVAMDLREPEIGFAGLAEGMGVPARRADTAKELKSALAGALAAGKPCLIDARVQNEELERG
ncbi:MAG: thiamine pyrophosphate-binding protein [Candidatus Tectomicrobia bacterium]|nr:thiamine pyrophosphate-binding protein [Candidatus Tectomicrobia bacterium]